MIQASTVKISTMADDTLRIVIDVEPRYAQEGFALFGARGTPCVLARLTPEAAKEQAQQEAQKPKGGELSRLAGMWCNDPQFRYWLFGDLNGSADEAAAEIRIRCDIASRADLDHDEAAAAIFHREIRVPFSEWLRDGGVTL